MQPGTTLLCAAALFTAAAVHAADAPDIGVPECDAYLRAYAACVSSKVPEASRGALQQSLDQMRTQWRAAAANADARAALGAACTQATAAAKTAYAAYGCQF